MIGEPFLHLHGFVSGVPYRTADADGVVVPQVPADFADDHGDGVCGEADVLTDIEIVDGLNQSNTAHLEQIVQIFSPLGEPLDNTKDQPQVAVHQLFPGLPVSLVHSFEQPHLLTFSENLQIGCVDPAYFHLVIQARSHPLCKWKYNSSIASCRETIRGLSWKNILSDDRICGTKKRGSIPARSIEELSSLSRTIPLCCAKSGKICLLFPIFCAHGRGIGV